MEQLRIIVFQTTKHFFKLFCSTLANNFKKFVKNKGKIKILFKSLYVESERDLRMVSRSRSSEEGGTISMAFSIALPLQIRAKISGISVSASSPALTNSPLKFFSGFKMEETGFSIQCSVGELLIVGLELDLVWA